MEKTLPQPTTRQGMVMFFVMLIAYTCFAANWVAGSALGPQITHYFFHGEPVSPVVSQVINYTITIARIFANFLAAVVLMRLGVKKAATIGTGLIIFALVAVWMPNYWLYTISRMIMALGASMVMVYLNPVESRFVPHEKKVIYSALITMTYNLGAFVVAILFAFFSDAMNKNWQVTMSVISGLSVLIFFVWLLVGKDFDIKHAAGHENNTTVAAEYGYAQAIKDRFIWIFALGFGCFLFLYVMSLTTYPAALPAHYPLLEKGWVTLSVAGGGILGTILGIVVGRRNLRRRPVCSFFGVLMIGMMMAAFWAANLHAVLAYVFMFLSGFFMYGQYSILLNIPHELPQMTPQRATIMFGIIWALGYFFYTLFNVIWSLVLEHAGWMSSEVFYFGMSSVYLIAIWLLPETNPKR